MSDAQNPFAAMMAMGQEMAKTLNPALESFTPKGFEALWPTMPKDMMETVMGKGLNPEGLDAKTKLLLTLGARGIIGGQTAIGWRLQAIQDFSFYAPLISWLFETGNWSVEHL